MAKPVPSFITKKGHVKRWNQPHKFRLGSRFSSPGFKKLLWKNGYASPHFTLKEVASKDGSPTPDNLRLKIQKHAFQLEKVRHDIGDREISPLSWYRSPSHNKAVGGAVKSKHLEGTATDWKMDKVTGGTAFQNALKRRFPKGGFGRNSAGQIVHIDNGPSRWWWYT